MPFGGPQDSTFMSLVELAALHFLVARARGQRADAGDALHRTVGQPDLRSPNAAEKITAENINADFHTNLMAGVEHF